jgi:hypothetical protein
MFLQQSLTGLYEASRSAILPLLARNENEMQKAAVLVSVSWSVLTAFASAAGGFMVTLFGTNGCFLADCSTYIVSAVFVWMMGGNWSVWTPSASHGNICGAVKDMMVDGLRYLRSAFFGGLIFLKFSAMWLMLDVVNVSLARRGGDEYGSARLGIMYSTIGVGSLIGTVITERYTDMDDPKTMQLSAILSLAASASACLLMGIQSPFWITCVLTGFRHWGVCSLWTQSTLLLQKFSTPEMLGRVNSIDLCIALIGESVCAMLEGILQDDLGLEPENVSALLGALGTFFTVTWVIYHFTGHGAASSYVIPKNLSSDSLTLTDDESLADDISRTDECKC